MQKFIKGFFAVAILGIAVQSFASKPEPEEHNLRTQLADVVVELENLGAAE